MIAASRTVLGERPDLVERRGVGDDAIAADATVSRLEADHAAKRRRLANRAAGIGAQRREAFVGGDRGGRAARRSARDALEIMRIARRPEGGILG